MLQQDTRTVALLAVFLLQPVKTLEHVAGADLVAPREQSFWIVHALRHRQLDVGRRGDAHVQRVHRGVHEHRERAVDDLLSE